VRRIEDLGERRIIEIILNCIDLMPNMPIPFGDDASAIEINHEKLAVIKSDMLVGKTDVPPGMNFRQAARKALVMNISDMAAKGVKPIAALVSLGVPRGLTEEDIKQIGQGLNEGAREYNAYILGGDTNEASDLIISCSILGIGGKNKFVRREGARLGDIVAVTGVFGKAPSGLKILMENLSVSAEIKDVLTEAVLMPRARLREGLTLAEMGAATSSIDSSDGLAWSLYELSKASNVGFLVEEIPIDPEVIRFAEEYNLDPIELSLYGGEEYELLVTVKPESWEKAKESIEELGTPLTRIGLVTEEKEIILKTKGRITHIEKRGWEHFKMAKQTSEINL